MHQHYACFYELQTTYYAIFLRLSLNWDPDNWDIR